jgi:hypothetical protein
MLQASRRISQSDRCPEVENLRPRNESLVVASRPGTAIWILLSKQRIAFSRLFFGECLQPRERTIPLIGDIFKISFDFFERLRAKLTDAFATGAGATKQTGPLQGLKMSRQSLPCEFRIVRER